MLRNEICGEYGDVIEQALYNTVLAGMALDGKHFFYVNPLEVHPESSEKDPGKSHIKPVRPQWLGCACCPPNLARLLASLDRYVYLQKKNTVYTVLFMNCEGEFALEKGSLTIKQETEYPHDGKIRFTLNQNSDTESGFAVRIPGWLDKYAVRQNGEYVDVKEKDGYIYFYKKFSNDVIELLFDMKIDMWEANPFIRSDTGKVAVSRGPFIYCLESVDNGENLHLLELHEQTCFQYDYEQDTLGGIGVITADGFRVCADDQDKNAPLYHKAGRPKRIEPVKIKMIPYYAWANRGINEMQVWIRCGGTEIC